MVLATRASRLIRSGAILALVLVALRPTHASAALILGVEPTSPVVLPGGTGSFEVVLLNLGLPVDIATFNYQLQVVDTSLISFTGVTETTGTEPYIFGSNGSGIQGIPGNDGGFSTFTVSDFLSSFVPPDHPFTLDTNGIVSLGLISFSVDAAAAGQVLTIGVSQDINFTFVASTNTPPFTPIGIDFVSSGSVQVVPEPSSILLMIGTGLLTFQHRRKLARAIEVVEA